MRHDKNDLVCLVLTTEKNNKKAYSLAKHILNKRYAACVNFREIKSIYWWRGVLEESGEVQLLIKTLPSQLTILIDEIKRLHSYSNPELIYWNASSGENYKTWIIESLALRD